MRRHSPDRRERRTPALALSAPMGKWVGAFVSVAAAGLLIVPAAASGAVKAGVASVDATWHVGASAGQYASDGTPIDAASGNFDPTLHSIRRAPSYGGT